MSTTFLFYILVMIFYILSKLMHISYDYEFFMLSVIVSGLIEIGRILKENKKK